MDNIKDDQIHDISHSEKTVSIVYEAINKLNGGVKVSDLVIITGLSIYNVEDALETLILEYPCRLHADVEGNLVYDFELVKKSGIEEMVFSKWILGVAIEIGKGFFKIWITFMLIAYFWIYFPIVGYGLFTYGFSNLLLGLIIMSASIIPVTQTIRFFIFLISKLFRVKKEHSVKRFSEKLKIEKELFIGKRIFFTEKVPFKWNFIKTTYHYVFGEKTDDKIDHLNLEKRILSFINSNEKRLTVAELIAITGWDIYRAEIEMTKIFVRYHGKAEVTEEGAILFIFPEIESYIAGNELIMPFCWQNLIPVKPWNHNFTFENIFITFTNIITLVTSFSMLILNINIDISFLPFLILKILNFHFLPFLFSAIFLIISYKNRLKFKIEVEDKINLNNRASLLLNKIFNSPNGIFIEENNMLFQKLIIDLEGIPYTDANGQIKCRFPYLIRDLNAINKVTQYNSNKRYEILNTEIPKIENLYDKYFGIGKRSYCEGNLVVVEKPDKIKIYIKPDKKETEIKLYILLVLTISGAFFLYNYYLQNLEIKNSLFTIYAGFLLFMLIGVYKQLATLVNTKVITISDHISKKSYPLFSNLINNNIDFWAIKRMYIEHHGRNFYRLMADTHEEHPEIIIDFIRNKNDLREIHFKLHAIINEN